MPARSKARAPALNDAQGAPMTIPGKYAVVWKKQQGGSWKAEADIFNTDK
jgi:ketosteroid isomerase-like protein